MVIDQPCVIAKFHKTVCLKMQKIAKHLLRIHFFLLYKIINMQIQLGYLINLSFI